ncbi:putative Ig domain-containing protein, partial [Oscillatoria sp. HE19RPO]|uniref:putative Ig domain-containing protein n=1 Tax=Oscillatoria sp. HE19RPO TaxID=2954806 RepID=UPI0020C27C4C
ISGSELYLKAGTTLDFATKSSYDVTVEVDDTTVGATPDATTAYSLGVTEVATNNAPVVQTQIADQSLETGNSFSLDVSGNFSDPDAGDTLTYSATLANGSPLPGWLSFDSVTGQFSGTPTDSHSGEFGVQVTATDSSGESISDSFGVGVQAAVPTPTPTPTPTSTPILPPGLANSITVTHPSGSTITSFTDPSGNTFRSATYPSGRTITSATDPSGRTITSATDPSGRTISSVTDPSGFTFTLGFTSLLRARQHSRKRSLRYFRITLGDMVRYKLTGTRNLGPGGGQPIRWYFDRSRMSSQDGPIAGATAFLDTNFNDIQDSDEPGATTDDAGNFTLNISGDLDLNGNGTLDFDEGQYVVVGGTDAITGQPFSGTLRSLPGSTVVTPLTTLVSALVDQGLSPEVAQTQVKTALGLPSNIDLSTFDPIAAAQAGSSEGLQVLAAQVAVQTLISQVSNVIGTSLGITGNGLDALVTANLAIVLESGSFNLGDSSAIQSLVNSTANIFTVFDETLNVESITNNSAQLAQVIAASNEQILTATSAEDIFQAQKVAQTSVTEDLSAAFSGTKSFDEVVAENTGDALTAQIDAATINTSVLTENQSFSSLFFDSDYYLVKNPDVAAAVENGTFASGLEHFGLFGAKEGRTPSYFFGETYLFDNPDVAAAVSEGAFSSAVEHFLQYGYKENRFPSDKLADFETFYLSQNADAAAMVANGTYGNVLEYLMTEGLSQGETLLSQFDVVAETFNSEDYLAKNLDVAEAVTNGLFPNALEHFIYYGMSEGRDPGEKFSNGDYLTENADVAVAVEGGAFRSAYEHYMMYGFKEGRPGTVEYDRLTGEPGVVDTFTLNLESEKDYTMISNFDAAEDIIQLPGTAADYQLAASPAGLPPGTAIYRLDGELSDLVGLVRDVSSLSLGEGYFSFG